MSRGEYGRSDDVRWRVVRPSPAPARTGNPVVDLLEQARDGLAQAAVAPTAAERFAAAHLAALRAGAAVLAARASRTGSGGRGRGRGPRNVWSLLADVAPELSEWSAFFAAGARKRAAAEAGLPRAVTAREADDLLRDAGAFIGLVSEMLRLPYQEPLNGAAIGLKAG